MLARGSRPIWHRELVLRLHLGGHLLLPDQEAQAQDRAGGCAAACSRGGAFAESLQWAAGRPRSLHATQCGATAWGASSPSTRRFCWWRSRFLTVLSGPRPAASGVGGGQRHHVHQVARGKDAHGKSLCGASPSPPSPHLTPRCWQDVFMALQAGGEALPRPAPRTAADQRAGTSKTCSFSTPGTDRRDAARLACTHAARRHLLGFDNNVRFVFMDVLPRLAKGCRAARCSLRVADL